MSAFTSPNFKPSEHAQKTAKEYVECKDSWSVMHKALIAHTGKERDALFTDAQKEKFVRLLSQVMTYTPVAGEPGYEIRSHEREYGTQWKKNFDARFGGTATSDYYKNICDSFKIFNFKWSKDDVDTLYALLDAEDSVCDASTVLALGCETVEECVRATIAGVREGCKLKNVEVDDALFTMWGEKLTKDWASNSDRYLHMGLSRGYANLAQHELIKADDLRGAFAFIAAGDGLPADLRAQDAFDRNNTALCKAITALDMAKIDTILLEDSTTEQLALGPFNELMNAAIRGSKTCWWTTAPTVTTPVEMILEKSTKNRNPKINTIFGKLNSISPISPSAILQNNGMHYGESVFWTLAMYFPDECLRAIDAGISDDVLTFTNSFGYNILHKLGEFDSETNVLVAEKLLAMPVMKPLLLQQHSWSGTPLKNAKSQGNTAYARVLVRRDPSTEYTADSEYSADEIADFLK